VKELKRERGSEALVQRDGGAGGRRDDHVI